MRLRHDETGVTLIELLVSMAIMGIVITLAGPTLISAISSTNRLQRTADAVDDAQLVSARLDHELRSATCIREPAENQSGNVLEFDTISGGSLSTVRYSVAGGTISRRQDPGPDVVLATRVGVTGAAFTQLATPLRTIELRVPLQSLNGGTFVLETTIAGRNAWRSC